MRTGRGKNTNSIVSRLKYQFKVGHVPSPDVTNKMKETKRCNPYKPTEEENRKRGETIRMRHLKFGFTEKEMTKGEKISKTKKGHSVTEETREKLRKAAKLQWVRDYNKLVQAVFHTRKPTKLETKFDLLLQTYFPGEWKYVGNGQVWIGGKCPDWINMNGKKKLIELFGNYWHKPEDEENRREHFKRFGFDTIVVWESELIDEKNLLDKFSNKGGDAGGLDKTAYGLSAQ